MSGFSALDVRTLRAVRGMPRGYPLGLNSRPCRRLTAAGYLRAKEVFNGPPGKSTLHFFLTARGEQAISNVSDKERSDVD
jgi:hypothetical protein